MAAAVEAAEAERAALQADAAALARRLGDLNEGLARKVCARRKGERERVARVLGGRGRRAKGMGGEWARVAGRGGTGEKGAGVGRRGVSLARSRSHFFPLPFPSLQVADRAQFESVLSQAEGAYAKILESAQALVAVLRHEAGSGRGGGGGGGAVAVGGGG